MADGGGYRVVFAGYSAKKNNINTSNGLKRTAVIHFSNNHYMKAIFNLILLVILFSACKKDHGGTTSPQDKITGKWNIISVTVTPLDSTGRTFNGNGGTGYIQPPYYYFQFNPD